MVTVQDVLDRLGTPPPEDVCLDWAYQLMDWPGIRTEHVTPQPLMSSASADVGLDSNWSRIAIDTQGRLHPLSPPTEQSLPTAEVLANLIEQLAHWSGVHSRLLRECKNLSDAKLPASATSLSTVACQTLPLSVSAKSIVEPKPGFQRRATGQRTWRRMIRGAFILFGIATLLCLSWLTVINRDARLAPNLVASPDDREIPPPVQSVAPSSTDQVDTALFLSGELAPDLSSASVEVPNMLNSTQIDSEPVLPQIESLLALHESELTTSDATVIRPALSTPVGPTLGNSQPPASSATEAPLLDVVEEVSQWSQAAEQQVLERKVNADRQTATAAAGPPLVLITSPAYQLQTFDLRTPARQPTWKLRLTVSEGVTVAPVETQVVQGREWASWFLSAEVPQVQTARGQPRTASTPTTQVMVQFQLAHSREPSLRWRIVAGADDFPGVLLPLESKLLDMAHAKLNLYIQWAASKREQLSTFAQTPGMPVETRNILYTQRRQLDAQRALATRWIQIVSDARWMQAGLDGQLELHASLMDTQPSPPVTLLQFGTP